jgi:hypothetical protein
MNTPNMHLDPELLSAYLDEEVTTDERQLIETHLPTCEACQQELASLRFTMALVQALPPRPIPRTFYVTEEMVAPQPKAQEAGWWGWLRGLAPFGAALAALLVVFVLARPLMVGTSGSATMPDAAPAMSEAEIALAPTSDPSIAAADSAASEETEETMETRQGDTLMSTVTTEDAQNAAEPPPNEAAGTESTSETTQAPTTGYSLTAPIVEAGGEDGTAASDITATEPLSVAETTPADKDTTMVTPAAMNTILIMSIILLMVAVGTLVIFARRRLP